jgi:hypothetical protein
VKIIKTFLAFLFALAAISFAVLVFSVKFPEKTAFGKSVKSVVIKYPFLVNTINLNQAGDWRYIYLKEKGPLKVRAVYVKAVTPNLEAGTWVSSMIQETLMRQVDYSSGVDVDIPINGLYSDDDLNEIHKKLIEKDSNTDLFIIYLSGYKEAPSYLGVTLHADAIFVFKKTIEELGENNDITGRLEQSTVMHEWGHLLGLEHLNYEGCIMSSRVDVYDSRELTEAEVPIEYCNKTLYELERIREVE